MPAIFWLTVGRLFMRDRSPVRRRLSWPQRIARFLAALIICGVGYAAYAIPRTEALQVQHVEVLGTDRLSREEVTARSGLAGASILRVPGDEAEARLEKLPYVASATVDSGWSTTVTVHVRERVPRLVWRSGGKAYLVDDSGMVLEEAPNNARLPVLDSPRGATPQLGGRVDPGVVGFALRLYSSLPPEVRPAANRLVYEDGRGYTLYSSAGWTAVIGDATQVGVKGEVLRRVLGRKAVSYVDVSNPATPYYRAGGNGTQ